MRYFGQRNKYSEIEILKVQIITPVSIKNKEEEAEHLLCLCLSSLIRCSPFPNKAAYVLKNYSCSTICFQVPF